MGLGIGSLTLGVQRSMRFGSDLNVHKGVEGEGGTWGFISTTGGDEGSMEGSIKLIPQFYVLNSASLVRVILAILQYVKNCIGVLNSL